MRGGGNASDKDLPGNILAVKPITTPPSITKSKRNDLITRARLHLNGKGGGSRQGQRQSYGRSFATLEEQAKGKGQEGGSQEGRGEEGSEGEEGRPGGNIGEQGEGIGNHHDDQEVVGHDRADAIAR